MIKAIFIVSLVGSIVVAAIIAAKYIDNKEIGQELIVLSGVLISICWLLGRWV